MQGHVKIDKYTGDGSAQNIELGFEPDSVQIYNATDGDIIGTWFKGMSDGTSIDISSAVALNATNGISAYAGSTGSTSKGFTVGTDFSENAKVYRYIALANQ